MKVKYNILIVIILTLFVLVGCESTNSPSSANNDNENKLSVYTSFYPMYDFALKIGEDKIKIENMVPAGTEPHDWEPTADNISALERADVFIYNGAGMEHWVDNVLNTLSNDKLTVVEASKGIDLLEGHNEGSFDPHVWLDPENAKIEMENIKNALVKADPDNSSFYENNYKKYAKDFDDLDKEFSDTLSPLPNKDIVVAHQAFGYLCAAYDLNQLPIEGLTPDSEPDPARMAEIIDYSKKQNIKVIFFEELVSPKVAETIAEAIDAETEVLNPIEGLSEEQQNFGSDYFSLMRQNLQSLKKSLE